MQIRQLIFQLSQTRVVSNRLILETCRHFFKEPRNHTQIFEWVAEHLHENLRTIFWQRLNQPMETSMKYVTLTEPLYPEKLRQIYNPPAILYYQGQIELLKTPMVAIVGARRCSHYSDQIVQSLVPTLVKQTITTVSGLAQGADACCHRETLFNQGMTVAVLGNSLDYAYPTDNRILQQTIQRLGLVISEYPVNTPPRRFQFPQRNRIIAGLCDTLVVTQARQKSGSLITAELALQENRNVWAAPGPINDPLSVGCNQLIAAGAQPYLNAHDLVLELKNNKKI